MSGRLGHTSPFIKRQGKTGPSNCIDQFRVDNWAEPEGFKTKQVLGITG
jgi:hypothetical protein